MFSVFFFPFFCAYANLRLVEKERRARVLEEERTKYDETTSELKMSLEVCFFTVSGNDVYIHCNGAAWNADWQDTCDPLCRCR